MAIHRNQGIAIAVLLAAFALTVLYPSAQAQPLTGDYVMNRLDQNCLKQDGWYWTGQTCLRCTNYTCTSCSGWYQCNNICPTGYSIFTDLWSGNKYCRACGTGDVPLPTVASCTFLSIQKDATLTGQWYDFQALTCQTGYVLIGGVCYGITGCANDYTQYGRCRTCAQGYYLTQDGYCNPCASQPWTSALSPAASAVGSQLTGVCSTCNGPQQCSTCGITWMPTIDDSYASYLATDIGRERYDDNIAAFPSQCRACSAGCQCSGPWSLCDSCLVNDGTWFYDPNQKRCFKCNSVCQRDESLLRGQEKHRVNCCNMCQWDQFLQKPRCTQCLTQFQDTTYRGQVVAVPDRYQDFGSNRFVLCYRCDRPNRNFNKFSTLTGLPSYTNNDFDYTNNFQYRMPDFTNASDSWQSFDYLNTTIPGDPYCTNCSLVQILNPTVSPASSTTNYTYPDATFNLNYFTCQNCQNGYEAVQYSNLPNTTFSFTAKNQWSGDTFYWTVPSAKTECRPCQYLIWNQDGRPTPPSDDPTNILNRYKYVRRCKNIGSPTSPSYVITQCGTGPDSQVRTLSFTSSSYVDYTQPTTSTSAPPDAPQRGPMFVENQWTGAPAQFSNAVASAVNSQSSYFFINSLTGTSFTEICLPNKWNCKSFATPINYTLLQSNAGQAVQCASCFVELGYQMTTGGHCALCTLQQPAFPIGCNSCKPNNVTGSDILFCASCITNANPSNWKAATFPPINYYYDPTQTPPTCSPCPNGCATCNLTQAGATQKNCLTCVSYWGLVTGAQNSCSKCTVPYCISCDLNIGGCAQCAPGFRMATLGNQTYCEACDAGCLTCTNDRKTCLTCNPTTTITTTAGKYYLTNGVCHPPFTGCVDWNLADGSCNWCSYGYTLRSGRCYQCFGELSGYIDCSSGGTNTAFQNNGTDVRRNQVSLTSRILSLLDEIDASF